MTDVIDIIEPADLAVNFAPEYPSFTIAEWREAVNTPTTPLMLEGYWEWVNRKLSEEANSTPPLLTKDNSHEEAAV